MVSNDEIKGILSDPVWLLIIAGGVLLIWKGKGIFSALGGVVDLATDTVNEGVEIARQGGGALKESYGNLWYALLGRYPELEEANELLIATWINANLRWVHYASDYTYTNKYAGMSIIAIYNAYRSNFGVLDTWTTTDKTNFATAYTWAIENITRFANYLQQHNRNLEAD